VLIELASLDGIDSQDPDFSARRPAQPLDALDGRGLSGPVGTDYPEYLTLGDGKGNPIHGQNIFVANCKLFHRY
jgi:hypothetical protein